MKKNFIKFLIFIGIFLLSGCGSKNDDSIPNDSIQLIPNSYYAYSKDECTDLNEFYFKDNDYTYYKVCIDYIELNFKNTKLVRMLDDSILTKETSLNDLINNSNKKINYGSYDIYLFNSFNLVIKDKNIYLLYKTINYEKYLDKIKN